MTGGKVGITTREYREVRIVDRLGRICPGGFCFPLIGICDNASKPLEEVDIDGSMARI